MRQQSHRFRALHLTVILFVAISSLLMLPSCFSQTQQTNKKRAQSQQISKETQPQQKTKKPTVLFTLAPSPSRGEVEHTKTHIFFSKDGVIRLAGEGGEVKDGKRWGKPCELVKVHFASGQIGVGEGKLEWLGVTHTFMAEGQEWGIAFARADSDIGASSCPGGDHILHGSGIIFGHKFKSDSGDPLTFKLVPGTGYVYIRGKGSVVTPTGKTLEF